MTTSLVEHFLNRDTVIGLILIAVYFVFLGLGWLWHLFS